MWRAIHRLYGNSFSTMRDGRRRQVYIVAKSPQARPCWCAPTHPPPTHTHTPLSASILFGSFLRRGVDFRTRRTLFASYRGFLSKKRWRA